MLKFSIILAAVMGLTACANLPRRPAQVSSDLPPAHSLATPLYSWTNNPAVLTQPNEFLNKQFEWVSSCNPKIAANPNQEVKGCEGNGLAAGPGVYTSDNPFTSHDYGSILLVAIPYANRTEVANGTGIAPADSMDRALTSSKSLEAIVYDFRANDFNTRAVVVRKPGLLDLSKTKAFKVDSSSPKIFEKHASFVCQSDTTVQQAVTSWADHMEFLSFTYATFNASEGAGFSSNGELNNDGLIAAAISDMTAMSEADLKLFAANLAKKFPKPSPPLEDSTCRETDSVTLKNCFYNRLYKSIVGDQGTPRYPTYAWELPLTLKILQELKVLSPVEAKSIKDNQTLGQFIATRFAKDPARKARATEAFGCMSAIRQQVSKNHFGMWAE